MKDIFGGKLTAGIFAMVGLFIGIIAAGIMAGPFGQLGSYFNDSAQFSSGSYEGTTFSKVYIEHHRGHHSDCLPRSTWTPSGPEGLGSR